MDFSQIVLMEIDKETHAFVRELDSYEASEGSEYITKFYYDGVNVNICFGILEDVEDWQYTGIYDLFNEEPFEKLGCKIEFLEEEYNPIWRLEFDYIEDYEEMQDKLRDIFDAIKEEVANSLESVKDKKHLYE